MVFVDQEKFQSTIDSLATVDKVGNARINKRHVQ